MKFTHTAEPEASCTTLCKGVLMCCDVVLCPKNKVGELEAVMAATPNVQRLPLNHPVRICARDVKLWRRDEARANAVGARRYRCPCPTCPGGRPLLRETILSHVRLLGRHHLQRGWTQVNFNCLPHNVNFDICTFSLYVCVAK